MARHWCDDTAYAIGLTSSTLVKLRQAQLPPPDQVVMLPTAVNYVRGDASRVGDGYRSCQWIWDVISIERLSIFLRLAGLAEGATSTTVYISTPLREGVYNKPNFRTYSTVMYKPLMTGKEGTPIARSPYAWQSVKVMFNKMVEV